MIRLKIFKCKECGSAFEEERRLLIHKKTHGQKVRSKATSNNGFDTSGHYGGASLISGGFGPGA